MCIFNVTLINKILINLETLLLGFYINCVIHELNDDKLDKRGKNHNSNSLLSSVDNFDQNRDLPNDRFKLISLNFFVSV